MMAQRTEPLLTTRGLRVAGLALLWASAVWLTFHVGQDPSHERLRYAYLPFLIIWTGLAILLPVILGPMLERLGGRVYLLIAVILLASALYYGIGRPLEIQALRDQIPFRVAGTFFDPMWELFLPLALGGVVAALYGFTYRTIRRSRGQAQPGHVFGTGVALYLLTGLLLWMHSLAAWVILRVSTGAPSPVLEPSVRFVDEAGPHAFWWLISMWPWMTVACCG